MGTGRIAEWVHKEMCEGSTSSLRPQTTGQQTSRTMFSNELETEKGQKVSGGEDGRRIRFRSSNEESENMGKQEWGREPPE